MRANSTGVYKATCPTCEAVQGWGWKVAQGQDFIAGWAQSHRLALQALQHAQLLLSPPSLHHHQRAGQGVRATGTETASADYECRRAAASGLAEHRLMLPAPLMGRFS